MNGLKKEGRVTGQVFDATAEKNKAAIKGYKFETHGLVVFKPGGKTVSHAENGHKFSKAQVEGWLKAAM